MKKLLEYTKKNLLLIILVLQPILDIIAYFQRDSAVSLAGYIRLAITLLVPAYVLFFARDRKKFIISMLVIWGFGALHVLNGFRVGYINIVSDVKYFLLVAHALVLLFSFIFLYEKDEIKRQIITALKIVLVLIVVPYYLSYFLKSGNHTYMHSLTGWTGWNNTQNSFSICLSAVFPFALYYCLSTKRKWMLIFLLPISYMYIMNGTKATYLTLVFSLFGFAVFLAAEFFIQKKKKFPFISIIVLIALLGGSIFCYNYSPRQEIDTLDEINIEETEKELEADEEKTEDVFTSYLDKEMLRKFGKERYLAAYKGELTAENLANVRLKKIIFGKLVWEKTDELTKFVGFEQAHMLADGETYDLESDPQAILFYYGYIGAFLYAAVLLYFWLRLIKQLLCHFKESFNLFNFTIFIGYGLLILSTLYSGYLLRRPNSSIYLMIVLLLIYCRTESLFKRKAEKG